jgi:hypothetical protein
MHGERSTPHLMLAYSVCLTDKSNSFYLFGLASLVPKSRKHFHHFDIPLAIGCITADRQGMSNRVYYFLSLSIFI